MFNLYDVEYFPQMENILQLAPTLDRSKYIASNKYLNLKNWTWYMKSKIFTREAFIP